MIATKKDPAIDKLILDVLGIDRIASVANNVCAFCGRPVTGFRDELSQKEFRISGLCQSCQDATFGTGNK